MILVPFRIESHKISDFAELKASGLVVTSLAQMLAPDSVPQEQMPWVRILQAVLQQPVTAPGRRRTK